MNGNERMKIVVDSFVITLADPATVAPACDIRLRSNNASFGLPEVRIGSIEAVGGIQQLMRSVPQP
jgi:E-phenylitaconyl-CoA hydratase